MEVECILIVHFLIVPELYLSIRACFKVGIHTLEHMFYSELQYTYVLKTQSNSALTYTKYSYA